MISLDKEAAIQDCLHQVFEKLRPTDVDPETFNLLVGLLNALVVDSIEKHRRGSRRRKPSGAILDSTPSCPARHDAAKGEIIEQSDHNPNG